MIVDLGVGCDELHEVLEKLLDEVDAALAGDAGRVLLSMHAGPLSDLFAPSEPEVRPIAGMVLWILHPGSLTRWIEDPSRLQTLLRRIHRMHTARRPLVRQCVYWMGEAEGGSRLDLELLRGLGLEMRLPEKDGVVLVEVERPEGRVLSALAGRIPAADEAVDPYPRVVNEEKDRAEAERDPARRERVEERERAFLAKRIVEAGEGRERDLPLMAPRLRRLLLEVASTGSDAAWAALDEELADRRFPLLLSADPATRSVRPRDWPGHGPGLAAYPDRLSFEWAAQDLKTPPGSVAILAMTPRELFAWAAKLEMGVAINVYRDRASPLYVVLSAEKVKARAAKKGRR